MCGREILYRPIQVNIKEAWFKPKYHIVLGNFCSRECTDMAIGEFLMGRLGTASDYPGVIEPKRPKRNKFVYEEDPVFVPFSAESAALPAIIFALAVFVMRVASVLSY